MPGHDLLDPLVDGAGAHQAVADHGLGLADAPGAVAGLVLDRRVPPAVVEHHVAGGGEVEAGAARLQRQHERSRAVGPLEVLDHAVTHATRQPAVVARDGRAGALGEVLGELHAPLGEVGEHQHALARREDRVDDLLEAGQLARTAGEGQVVVLVRGGVVADLLERGDGGEDLALAGLGTVGQVVGEHELVEHRLVEADLLGGHRAVVELVDLVGQLGGDLGLGLGATEHEDAVERPQRAFGGRARPPPSPESDRPFSERLAMNCGADPRDRGW